MIEASFRSPPLRRWRRAVANMIADVVACGIVSRASSDIIAIGALLGGVQESASQAFVLGCWRAQLAGKSA